MLEFVARNDLPTPNASKGVLPMMADLKGKKIGVPSRGSAAESAFRMLARLAGLDENDFTYVAVGGPDTSHGALTSGQIDASSTFEPSGTLCDVLKTCKLIMRAAEVTEPKQLAGVNGASSNIVVSEEMIKSSPKLVSGLISAAKDAEAFVQDPNNFAETLAIAKSYFQFKFPRGEEVMEASLRRAIPAYKAELSRPAMQQAADNMLEMKQIPARFDSSKVIYELAP